MIAGFYGTIAKSELLVLLVKTLNKGLSWCVFSKFCESFNPVNPDSDNKATHLANPLAYSGRFALVALKIKNPVNPLIL